jgi:hypothetical membrane protein
MSIKDKDIKDKIESKLRTEKRLDLSNVKTTVLGGIVTLEGTINEFWGKVRAETLTRAISGVKGVKNKLSIIGETFSEENLKNFTNAYLSKIECLFGLIGVSVTLIFIIISALLTPNYNPLVNTVSSLGKGVAKTLFSIGFVTGGALGIPFVIYVEKTLYGLNDFVRRIATSVAVITSLCIALVGILPDPEFLDTFLLFHVTVALIAFIGSVAYISLYTYLMMKSAEYKIYHLVLGYLTSIDLILLALTGFSPLVEWILTINILLWTAITSVKLLRKKIIIESCAFDK